MGLIPSAEKTKKKHSATSLRSCDIRMSLLGCSTSMSWHWRWSVNSATQSPFDRASRPKSDHDAPKQLPKEMRNVVAQLLHGKAKIA